ncbi:hypothetical protein [Vibrio coralliilyticus]|nr:hypothetical protein [Vibrio coralliilyticus]
MADIKLPIRTSNPIARSARSPSRWTRYQAQTGDNEKRRST